MLCTHGTTAREISRNHMLISHIVFKAEYLLSQSVIN
jgi:hypothetical protein